MLLVDSCKGQFQRRDAKEDAVRRRHKSLRIWRAEEEKFIQWQGGGVSGRSQCRLPGAKREGMAQEGRRKLSQAAGGVSRRVVSGWRMFRWSRWRRCSGNLQLVTPLASVAAAGLAQGTSARETILQLSLPCSRASL